MPVRATGKCVRRRRVQMRARWIERQIGAQWRKSVRAAGAPDACGLREVQIGAHRPFRHRDRSGEFHLNVGVRTCLELPTS
jgi:hypothetical protein